MPSVCKRTESENTALLGGRTLTWKKEANIKLLAAWLVLTWNELKGSYDRSVRTAEDGKVEDLAAIYRVRVKMGDLSISRMNKRYILKVPNSSLCLDGTPRSSDAVPTKQSKEVTWLSSSTPATIHRVESFKLPTAKGIGLQNGPHLARVNSMRRSSRRDSTWRWA